MARYLISYNIENFRNRLIVILAKDKNDAKKMLKRHMGNKQYTINKITEENVNDA